MNYFLKCSFRATDDDDQPLVARVRGTMSETRDPTPTNHAMNRSRGVVVFDNGKSIAATRLSRPFPGLRIRRGLFTFQWLGQATQDRLDRSSTRTCKPDSTKAKADCAVDKRCRAIPYSPAAARRFCLAMRPKPTNLPHGFHRKPSRFTQPINFATPFNETWGAATGYRHSMRNHHADKKTCGRHLDAVRYGEPNRGRRNVRPQQRGRPIADVQKAKTAGNHKLHGSDRPAAFLRYQINSGRPVNLTVIACRCIDVISRQLLRGTKCDLRSL